MSYVEKNFSLSGKTAIVTGGGGVLCGAIAQAYVKAGANIILWGHRNETLDNAARQIKVNCQDEIKIITIKVDCTKESQVINALNESLEEFNQIDILVNGVGGSSKRTPLTETNIDEFDDIVRLNLIAGCILPTKHIAKYWIEKNVKGCIVNIASMGSFQPLSGGWAYSAAKAAVVNQTIAHAKELAPYGIRVNAIAPGFFMGKQNKALLVNNDGSFTKRGKDILSRTPMGRFGEPEDLASCAIFLASQGAGFISGATIPVDGAYLCDNI